MKKIPVNFINILILQLGWWATTLSIPKSHLYISSTLLLLIVHFVVCQTKNRTNELYFILLATALGCIADFIAIQLNIYEPVYQYFILPTWLICYWLIFSTSFSYSLSWLRKKWILISSLGFVFGPLTYYAGEKFNILKFNVDNNIINLILYGLIWAVLYPILFTTHEYVKTAKKS